MLGFYLPFNWRGYYDFGSSLIGDWGVHILGPANWALGLSPEHLVSVECIKKDGLPAFTFPDVFTIKYEFKARKTLEKERDQIRRLLKAAKQENATVHAIKRSAVI